MVGGADGSSLVVSANCWPSGAAIGQSPLPLLLVRAPELSPSGLRRRRRRPWLDSCCDWRKWRLAAVVVVAVVLVVVVASTQTREEEQQQQELNARDCLLCSRNTHPLACGGASCS